MNTMSHEQGGPLRGLRDSLGLHIIDKTDRILGSALGSPCFGKLFDHVKKQSVGTR